MCTPKAKEVSGYIRIPLKSRIGTTGHIEVGIHKRLILRDSMSALVETQSGLAGGQTFTRLEESFPPIIRYRVTILHTLTLSHRFLGSTPERLEKIGVLYCSHHPFRNRDSVFS